MVGLIIKRQAKLTPDQAKHLDFNTPTRGLEADRMMDAVNRLNQTDAREEQILGDRAEVEHGANNQVTTCGGNCGNPSFPRGWNRTTIPLAAQRRTPRVNNWIGTMSVSMMTVTLWLTRTGQLWYLFKEMESWTKPKQVRCQLGHKVTGKSEKTFEILLLDGVTTNPSQVDREEECAKRRSRKKHTVEIETSEHHFAGKQKTTAPNASLERTSENVLLIATVVNNLITWRESVKIWNKRTILQHQRKVFSCQETPLHS